MTRRKKKERSKSDYLNENTLAVKLGLWASNLRDNLTDILSSPEFTPHPKYEGPALIVGGGSSLAFHLNEIKEFKGTIFACETSLVPLLMSGVVPDFLVSIDGDQLLLRHMLDPIVDIYMNQITALFSITTSPVIVKRWRGPKKFFAPYLDDTTTAASVSQVFRVIANHSNILHTGGNVGTTMWFMASHYGFCPIVMVGIDMAYPGNLPDLSATQVWGMVKNLSREEILQFYCRVKNPFGQEVITDYMWDGLKEAWFSWIKSAKVRTIQCSDLTILFDKPIEVMTFREYLEQQG
jgi:hypothetical protein